MIEDAVPGSLTLLKPLRSLDNYIVNRPPLHATFRALRHSLILLRNALDPPGNRIMTKGPTLILCRKKVECNLSRPVSVPLSKHVARLVALTARGKLRPTISTPPTSFVVTILLLGTLTTLVPVTFPGAVE